MSGILTTTAEETHDVGTWLAHELLEGLGARDGATVIALTGPLGSGKTTLVQGLAAGLGIEENLQSPTYVLLKEYAISAVREEQPTTFVHVDCYRLEDPNNLFDLGFQEMLDDPNRIVVIEWAERIRPAIPMDALWVELTHITQQQRRVVIAGQQDTTQPAPTSQPQS